MVRTLNIKHKTLNKTLFRDARKYIPGGVNSPVRSFKAVEGEPVFIRRASGSKMYGEDGRAYIDYCMSWGALILGHAHPAVIRAIEAAVENGTSFGAATRGETELARLISEAFPSIEQVRLTNSGTEAVMGAVRLARAYTRRDAIIKFQGSYHGHADYLLNCAGVPKDFTRHTLTVPYNDLAAVEKTMRQHQGAIAAILVEPVAGNCGVVPPEDGFLEGLRTLAARYGVVLIFDEVITGFRLSYGGAQKLFNVRPDLTCLGKIIGGGLPVGAFGGRRDIMRLLSPEGPVYQAGTLSGNPVAVAAGIATLKLLKKINPYAALEQKTKKLCAGIREAAAQQDGALKLNSIASMFGFQTESFNAFYHKLLKRGIYCSPSVKEANFLSLAHTDEDIDRTIKAFKRK